MLLTRPNSKKTCTSVGSMLVWTPICGNFLAMFLNLVKFMTLTYIDLFSLCNPRVTDLLTAASATVLFWYVTLVLEILA